MPGSLRLDLHGDGPVGLDRALDVEAVDGEVLRGVGAIADRELQRVALGDGDRGRVEPGLPVRLDERNPPRDRGRAARGEGDEQQSDERGGPDRRAARRG